jgi:hypothetical protein
VNIKIVQVYFDYGYKDIRQGLAADNFLKNNVEIAAD